VASPIPFSQSEQGGVEAAQRTEEEENGGVGCGDVDGVGGVGDGDGVGSAGWDGNLVVSGACGNVLWSEKQLKRWVMGNGS
jgi:hypothetical protein